MSAFFGRARGSSTILHRFGPQKAPILVTFGLQNRWKNQYRFQASKKSPPGAKMSPFGPLQPSILFFLKKWFSCFFEILGRLLGSILSSVWDKFRVEFSTSFGDAFWGVILNSFGPHRPPHDSFFEPFYIFKLCRGFGGNLPHRSEFWQNLGKILTS